MTKTPSLDRLAFMLALLSAIGPFAIDAYLPAFPQIAATLGATQLEVQQTLTVYMAALALMVLWHGALADRFGRRTLLGATAAAIAAFSGFAPQLLDAGQFGEATFMILGFALLGLSFGQSSGALSSNFQPRHRYTGSAFTSDLAWLFGAGFAPIAALLLSTHSGLASAGAYLLSGAACTLVALWLNRELARTIE